MAMCNAQQIKSGVFDALHTTAKHVPDVCNLKSKYSSNNNDKVFQPWLGIYEAGHSLPKPQCVMMSIGGMLS